jgi:hypothetical protein
MSEKSLHSQLLEGIGNVKVRPDGTVHTVHGGEDGKQVVAEVCVGKRATRLNLRFKPKTTPKNVQLVGKSKTWVGGGVVVTADNVAACRSVLTALLDKPAAPKKQTRKPAAVAA